MINNQQHFSTNYHEGFNMRYLTILMACLLSLPAGAMDYPDSRRENTSNSYHAVEVADPYQWLEDWSSAEVKAWSASQNKVAMNSMARNGPYFCSRGTCM